jgi:hypothetical protein
MSLFADPSAQLPTSISDLQPTPHLLLETPPSDKQGFVYLRFEATEEDLTHPNALLPGLGFGYRRLEGNGAADISMSGIGRSEHRSGRFLWTAPKVSYLHYLQPDAEKSAYVGGGLAWGGVYSREQRFTGIIPSVAAGYEFARKKTFLGFAEFTVSQPAISLYQQGSIPGPIGEFSTGIGF